MSRQTVYVVDDDEAVVNSLVWMLEDRDYKVQGFTDTTVARTQLDTLSPVNPACLLLDVRMPQVSGLDFHDQLLEAGIDVPIIYLTGHGDVALAVEAMSKGALTFIEKPVAAEELYQALESAFSAQVQSQRQSTENRLLAGQRADLIASLTAREAEVLAGIVEGHSGKEIAESLFISAKTVEYHRAKIMAKLQAKSIAHLQRIVALNNG